jgi:EF-hand domain-containing protein 1
MDTVMVAASTSHATRSLPGAFNKKLYAEKLFQEARLGKFIRDPRKRAQFQENDGKVLRFDCLWNDTREGGDPFHYILQWHLADSEAELLEVHERNDGRDPTPAAVSKRRIPKNWKKVMTIPGDPVVDDPSNWMTPSDILVGSTVDVFGRSLFVRGADAFTRDWYKENLGIELAPAQYDREVEPPLPKLPPPPHTGIGDPDDAMQSTKTFAPKPPKKDFDKWARNEGKVYRFKARLVIPPHVKASPDAERRFTIKLFPTDDTLAIFEPPLRNSGQWAGKFLVRAKHRHSSGRLYVPTDFKPGATIVINSSTFRVDDADPDTRSMVPAVNIPVPLDGRDNMFPRGPSTASADGVLKVATA